MQITGKITPKRYRCNSCGHESTQMTNHYGEIYPRCSNCGWRHPMEMGQVHVCLEPLPKNWGTPEPWKMIQLGDIATVTVVKERKKR